MPASDAEGRPVASSLQTGRRKLVGATGFESATPCAQGRCATRLRYAPTLERLSILPDSLRDQEKILTKQQRERQQGSQNLGVRQALARIFLLPERDRRIQSHPQRKW